MVQPSEAGSEVYHQPSDPRVVVDCAKHVGLIKQMLGSPIVNHTIKLYAQVYNSIQIQTISPRALLRIHGGIGSRVEDCVVQRARCSERLLILRFAFPGSGYAASGLGQTIGRQILGKRGKKFLTGVGRMK